MVIAVVVALPAVVVVRIRTDSKAPARPPALPLRRLLEPLAGFAALLGNPPVRGVVAVVVAQSVMRGLLNVYVIVAAVSVLDVGRAGAGPLFAAGGVGGLLGSVLALASTAGRRLALPFAIGMSLWGLPVLLTALAPEPAVAFLALAVVGAGNAVGDVNGLTALHRLIPDHLLGRAFGALFGCAMAGVGAGSLAAAPLIDGIGLLPAMGVSGLVMALIPVLLWPRLRQVDTQVAVDEDRITLLTAGDCFGESALLHRVPRTATVVALTPARLLAIDADTFIAAVTSNPAAETAALSLADTHLRRSAPRPVDAG